MDGIEWVNNSGAITVNVSRVPEPDVYAMFVAGLILLGAAKRAPRRAGKATDAGH